MVELYKEKTPERGKKCPFFQCTLYSHINLIVFCPVWWGQRISGISNCTDANLPVKNAGMFYSLIKYTIFLKLSRLLSFSLLIEDECKLKESQVRYFLIWACKTVYKLDRSIKKQQCKVWMLEDSNFVFIKSFIWCQWAGRILSVKAASWQNC